MIITTTIQPITADDLQYMEGVYSATTAAKASVTDGWPGGMKTGLAAGSRVARWRGMPRSARSAERWRAQLSGLSPASDQKS